MSHRDMTTHAPAEVDLTLPLSRHVAAIVHAGAILQHRESSPVLVGACELTHEGHLRWFAAFGDQPADAHEFLFHYARADEERVFFIRSNGDELLLSSIDQAAVDDKPAFRTTWRSWLRVASQRRAFISTCFAQLDTLSTKSRQSHPTNTALPSHGTICPSGSNRRCMPLS